MKNPRRSRKVAAKKGRGLPSTAPKTGETFSPNVRLLVHQVTQLEDGHEHTNNDRSHGNTQEHDQEWLNQ